MTTETAIAADVRIAELVGNMESIATLPEVAARINATMNDPRSSAADLQKIILRDPALVGRILKLVNSTRYSSQVPIDSVERAVVRLGFQTVQGLAIAASLGRLFTGTYLGNDFTARDLWMHCVAVATAAQEMARKVCPLQADQVFLAGLMHDLGLLASVQTCPEEMRQVCERAKWDSTPFVEIERQVIGADHQQLGAALAERWGFPPACREVAAHHHNPKAADADWRQVVALVHSADTLCCEDAIGFNLTAAHQLAQEPGFEDVVPPKLVDWARTNLPDLVGDAILMFS
jgi:putative nucleotidyltransferase with HDIG domain